jgi:CheY-like chemotaxis protein
MSNPPTLLLVEDTPEIRQMYQFGLTKNGFAVTSVGSAGEALSRVQSGAYDIILLDLMLGGMSGLDFLKEAHIKLEHPDTKIVVFTNIDNPEVMEKVKAEGIDGYLLKSQTDPKALNIYLRQLLGMPPAPAEDAPAQS